MRSRLLIIVTLGCLAHAAQPQAHAQVGAGGRLLFERDGAGGAALLLHPYEIPALRSIAFDLPTGPVELDTRVLSQRGPASYSIAGTDPDRPLLHAMITVEGPAIVAVISHPDLGTHRFEHTDRTGGRVFFVEPPTVPACGCDCATHEAHNKRPVSAHADAGSFAPVRTDADAPQATPRGVGLCEDSFAQIDILVLYTQNALSQAGGDVATLQASVQMGVDEFNLACQNSTASGSPAQIRLVHTAFTPYAETTTSSATHLRRLRDAGDGHLDDAHALRDAHQADIVMLVTGPMDVCGRAYIGVLPGNTPRPDLAFGVVQYNCISAPVYAFAHEVGHILGALHDVDADYCDTGSRTYAHGYVAPDESFRTVMATSGSAPRILYFSDPDATFMGQPAGDPAIARNNAAFLAGAADVVARYRLSDCNGNGICDDHETGLGLVDDLDGNGVPDMCQRDEDQNGVIDSLEIMNDPGLDLDADGMLDSVELPVRYVDASATGTGTGLTWADAHTDLHVAIDAVVRSGGDIAEIWIAQGVYSPAQGAEARASTYTPPSNVTIYGSFAGTETSPGQRDIEAHPTIISGDLEGQDDPDMFTGYTDNLFTLMQLSSVTGVVIDGLTFDGGYGDTKSNCGFYNYGGGLFAFMSEYTLRNCTFFRCSGNNGGALATTNSSAARVIDCDFIGNQLVTVDFLTAGGDVIDRVGSATAAYMISAPGPENDAYIENCRFIENRGGAALVNLGGAPTIIGCLIARNEAEYVAGINNSSTGGSDATIINCTIVDNTSTYPNAGVGVGNFRSDVTIINSIIHGNRSSLALNADTQVSNVAGTAVIADSIVEGPLTTQASTTLINVQDADPQFMDPAAGDYTLAPASPAIDAGDTSALDAFTVTTDLAGADRFIDDPVVVDTGAPSVIDPARPIVDIGAFERVPGGCATDFDGDGDVDLSDFGVFGADFGRTDC